MSNTVGGWCEQCEEGYFVGALGECYIECEVLHCFLCDEPNQCAECNGNAFWNDKGECEGNVFPV